jgi:predicted nucleic acid-binding Zn ribbon protein
LRSTYESGKKVCSLCKVEKNISEFTRKRDKPFPYCRTCLYLFQIKRWNTRKIEAIKYLGGRCKDCGLVDHPICYDFHHRDPESKEVDWGELKIRKWSSIIQELDKCDLLCAICHRKRHIRSDIWVESKPKIHIIKKKCKICLKEIPSGQTYCSSVCSHYDQEKIKWPDDLIQRVQNSSMLAVAKELGVSDKAVKKRINKHGGLAQLGERQAGSL